MNIELNFINQSNDQNNSSVVIFQENSTTSFDDVVIPSKVLNCPPGESRKFTLTHNPIIRSMPTDGQSLAAETVIAAQHALNFKPSIWIGVVSHIHEGEVLDSAILNDINTELSLLGITKANLTMTGGGPEGAPFKFAITPVV